MSEWGGAGSLDEKMIADLREWRSRITPAPSEAERSAGHPYSVQIRLKELDALLAAVAERDDARREACAMPDENVTPIRAVHYFGAARVVPVDLATLVDARVEEDERVIAWDAIAAHPFFRECYGAKTSLLDAMLAKLTASTFTADIPAEVRERAAEPEPARCRHCGGLIGVVRGAWEHIAYDASVDCDLPAGPRVDVPDILPFCDCGSVDKNGDDLGEHGPRCPYHLAVLRISPTVTARELDELCRRTLAAQARLA